MTVQTTEERSAPAVAPPTADQVEQLVELLRSWAEGDADEQRETWEYLKKALDEDRPSYRKLFP